MNQKRKSFSNGNYKNKKNKTINYNNYFNKKPLYNNNLKIITNRYNHNISKNNILLNKIIRMKNNIKDKKYSSIDSINKNRNLNKDGNNNYSKYLKLYKEKEMGKYNFQIRLNLKKIINRIESDLLLGKTKSKKGNLTFI